MIESTFIIIFHGGCYEDAWDRPMEWGFDSFEKAEAYLKSKHYKKETAYWTYWVNTLYIDDWEQSCPYTAEIKEIKVWKKKVDK